jgi:hypothetical protein
MDGASKEQSIGNFKTTIFEIAQSGEWSAISSIASLTSHPSTEIATATALVIHQLLACTRPHELRSLDQALRHIPLSVQTGPFDASWLYAANLTDIASLPHTLSLLKLASCHCSGHAREAALKRLNLEGDGSELGFYVLRLRDWVSEVRAVAESALSSRISSRNLRGFIAILPLIHQIRDWRTAEHSAVLQSIENLIVSEEGSRLLRIEMVQSDIHMRRAALHYAMMSKHITKIEVMREAATGGDAFTRLWASQVLGADASNEFDQLVELLLRDSIGTIRSRALELALARGIDVDLMPLLFDRHAAIRSTVQAELLLQDVDVKSVYLQNIASRRGKARAVAILGLLESSRELDHELLRDYLSDDCASVRAAALHVLATLESEDLQRLALRALADPCNSVGRVARTALIRIGERPKGEKILEILRSAKYPNAQLHAIAVLSAFEHWESLRFLLQAFTLSRASVQDQLICRIEAWLQAGKRIFTRPTNDCRVQIEHELENCNLPPELRMKIRTTMERA